MSWSGYIPGDLVRDLWKDDMNQDWAPTYDRTGMNTSSESPASYRIEPNAPDDGSGLSSWQVEESFLRGITVLQQALQAASKVRAREDLLTVLSPAALTTPGEEHVSPFTVRLIAYYGLIVTIAEELRSIVPIPPVTDVSASFEEPVSRESSTPPEKFARIDTAFEPPYGSIVLDGGGDVWQNTCDGWSCAYGGELYRHWEWEKLRDIYPDMRLIRWGS